MKDYFKPKTWLITTLMFMVALGLSSAIVYYEFGLRGKIIIASASASNNVTGWAWNSNTSWISFNCTNDTPPCGASNYGVSLDLDTGDFSGYAWSYSLGWISFNRSDTGDPPSQPYKNGTILANYNSSTGKVDGWAKILSLGDNGWIKLRKFASDSGADYGVTINPATGDFSGWAWQANDGGAGGVGWVSFNCAGESPACSGTNYKVVGQINRAPTAVNLTAPNWSYYDAATLGALNAKLGWTFNDPDAGSSESAYQIKINTKNNKNDPNPTFDSGKCLGLNNPINKCKVGHGPTGITYFFPLGAEDGLNYGTAYYWWVQAWDNHDVASDLTQYNTSPDTDNNDGVAPTFTTYKHKFPLPGATYFPANPNRGEKVKFTDTSKTYLTAAPAIAISCDAGNCAWTWTAPSGATIDDAATSTPTIIFNRAGSNSLKLKVTDKVDGYYTEITIPVEVNAKLPKWQEVKPE